MGRPSNHGEGQFFLDQDTTVQDTDGDAIFTCSTSDPSLGQEVSATATNTASGDTSEFSLNEPVVASP